MLQALASPATYRGHPPVTLHQTHASWVFVAGERAYKVKKPVALSFLDYSTLARRHEACREEVRVNQELAPGLYLGVRAIVRCPMGFRLAPEGAPNAVEYAVEMRSFHEEDTMAGLIATGSLTREHVAATARLLANFHRSAPVAGDSGPDRVLAMWSRNIEELQRIDHPEQWRLGVVAAFGEAFISAHEPELRRRALEGLMRDGHGDLRCEHVLTTPTVRIVDRIEFDPGLRHTDIACDLAFLAMDLEAHGQPWAARELHRAYSDGGMDLGGETLRSFYAAHWALVRAKVALITAAEHSGEGSAAQLRQAWQLWSLSERLCWRARTPRAIVICGPSASGKSVLAAELSRRSDMPVVSSDAVRKRLAHLAPSQPARAEHYTAGFTRATYERLGRDALFALRRGGGVIVDATCRSRRDRAPLLAMLRRAGPTPAFVRCEVPLGLAMQRAARRLHDSQRVSDATPRIAAEQFRTFEELTELPLHTVLRLDTSRPLDAQVAEVALAVDRLAACADAPGSSRRAGSSAAAANARRGSLDLEPSDRTARGKELSTAALAFRTAHAVVAMAFMLAIAYVWWCALSGHRGPLLRVAAAALGGEGLLVLANHGDCPLGGMQQRLGDQVPLFELFLSRRADKRGPRPRRHRRDRHCAHRTPR
jgi:aminoglycoside phosphotransferase family enzyme/predicted kinase